MSAYIRIKAIRCRLKNAEQYFKDKDYKDTDDIAETLKIHKEYEIKEREFNVSSGLNYEKDEYEYFLDYNLFRSYGEEGSDFSYSRKLYSNERKKYLKFFKRLFPDIKAKDLRYVDYCYYNGVDEPAIFEIEEV